MYCGQCGTHNNEESGHCETCGAPLLISAGARSCSNCGASLGDNDRYCTSCGTAADSAQVDPAYSATDDFGELEIEDLDLSELPDWLREMAPPSEEEPADLPDDVPVDTGQADAVSQDAPGASPDDLPDWLRDPEGTPASAPAAPPQAEGVPSVDHQPADQFSLVTDEDLPDWLKALSDDEPESEQAATPSSGSQAAAGQTSAVATLFEVPPVNRAWLTQGRRIDQQQIAAAQQDFAPLEVIAARPVEQQDAPDTWESGRAEPAPEFEATRPISAEWTVSEGNRGRLILRISLIVLIVIVVLLVAFLLLQGL